MLFLIALVNFEIWALKSVTLNGAGCPEESSPVPPAGNDCFAEK
jgi:hypothetical protein